MKKALKYIIILAVSMVLTLAYGFLIGGDYTPWIAFMKFAVSIIILVFFDRKPSREKLFGRIAKIIATAAVVIVFSASVYIDVNSLSTTFIDSYEVNATCAWINKAGVHIEFESSDGVEQGMLFNEYELSDEEIDNLPYDGGRIMVAEYEGLFGMVIYKYLGTVE